MDRENKSADDVRQESKRLYPLLSEKEKRMVLTEAYRYLQQEAERRWKLAEGKRLVPARIAGVRRRTAEVRE